MSEEKNQKKYVSFGLSVPLELKIAVEHEAEKIGLSKSAYVQQLLRWQIGWPQATFPLSVRRSGGPYEPSLAGTWRTHKPSSPALKRQTEVTEG